MPRIHHAPRDVLKLIGRGVLLSPNYRVPHHAERDEYNLIQALTMFLSRFRVRGYKCLHDIDLSLRPFHVLCGPSGSGKTSLLEAIAAFQGRLKTPSSNWFPPTDKMLSLVEHGSASPSIDLSAEWSELSPDAVESSNAAPLAGFGYSIVLPERGTTLGVVDQWVRPRIASAGPPRLAQQPTPYPRRASAGLTEDTAAHETFRNVIQKALQPVQVYRLCARRLAEPAVDVGQGLCLDADGHGHGLPVVLDNLRADSPERYQSVIAAFAALCPQFIDFELTAAPTPVDRRRKSAPPLMKSLSFRLTTGQTISAMHVASGAILLLGYLVLTQLTEPPGPLLIENPEAGLQTELLAQVLQVLRNAAKGTGLQVILTTHSAKVIESAISGDLSCLS